MRLLADVIRGMEVEKALAILEHHPQHNAVPLAKLLKSAINNWEQKNEGGNAADANLVVKTIFVEGGRVLKRMRPAPQGRGYRVRKRSNHVTIIVDSNTDNRVPSVKKLIPKEEPVATEPVKKTEKTTKPVTKKAPAKPTPAAKKATPKK